MSIPGRLAPLCVALAVTLAAVPARAEFENIRRVFSGSAYTLDQGELAVGIFSPLQYGIIDEVTIASHPLLDLLLTPNLTVRWKVYDGPVALSLSGAYIQSFLSGTTADIPGSFSFYPTLSIPFTDFVSLSIQAGYVLDLDPIDHGFLYGTNLGVLVGSADLLWLGVQGQVHGPGSGFEIPSIILAYTHAWSKLRLTVGIAVGRFPTQVGTSSTRIMDIPVYPVIDVWWLL